MKQYTIHLDKSIKYGNSECASVISYYGNNWYNHHALGNEVIANTMYIYPSFLSATQETPSHAVTLSKSFMLSKSEAFTQ